MYECRRGLAFSPRNHFDEKSQATYREDGSSAPLGGLMCAREWVSMSEGGLKMTEIEHTLDLSMWMSLRTNQNGF